MTTRSRAAVRRAAAEALPTPVDLGPLPALVGYALRRAQLSVFQDFVQTMAARGLAERRPGARDRRAHALALTASGKALMRQLQARVAEHERRQVDRLGAPGKAQLLRLLAKLS